MTVMMAISTISQVSQQQQQADSQNASNAQQRQYILQSQADNSNQVNLARLQSSDAAAQKINANNMSQREAQATAIARAGPSGLSVDALLADMGRKGATYNQSVNENLERTGLQLDEQQRGVNNNAYSQMNSLKTPAPVDYLGAALKIGTSYQQSSTYSGGDGDIKTKTTTKS
jgi:hypothetical protein